VDKGYLRRYFVEFVPSVGNSGHLGPYLGKSGPKTDFWSRTREIRPFLAAIFPEKANMGEIAAQNAAIITGGK